MEKGTRVIHKDGAVGYVEAVANNFNYPIIDVRWLTPNNEPSACVSMCRPKDLKPVLDHVVPMQRNDAWWREAREFCSAIENALHNAKIQQEHSAGRKLYPLTRPKVGRLNQDNFGKNRLNKDHAQIPKK